MARNRAVVKVESHVPDSVTRERITAMGLGPVLEQIDEVSATTFYKPYQPYLSGISYLELRKQFEQKEDEMWLELFKELMPSKT